MVAAQQHGSPAHVGPTCQGRNVFFGVCMVSRQDCSAIVALVGSSSAPCLGLAKKKSSNLAFPQLDKLTMVSFFSAFRQHKSVP
jgi:hypothetical protein